MTTSTYATTGLALWILLAMPPMRSWMEASMVLHMGVQIPLLVVAGVSIGMSILARRPDLGCKWNGYGIAGILTVLFTVLFWMLPRNLDAALNSTAFEITKFLTLPLLAGVPLALSWPRLPLIGKGIVWSNFLAMLFVLAWLYLEAPVRVCNNYLINEQARLGAYLLGAGIVVAAFLAVRVFLGNGSVSHESRARRKTVTT